MKENLTDRIIVKYGHPIKVKHWGQCDYLTVFNAMQQFTYARQEDTLDEIWYAEHYPVYTLGKRGTLADLIQSTEIPIIKTDRGGKITYHGPGQLVIYPLLNLKRLNVHLRSLVNAIEHSVIQMLWDYHIHAYADPKAPGIYIDNTKIASLGLRIHKQYCYHGLAINIHTNLKPFLNIHPCGLKNMRITNLTDWIGCTSSPDIAQQFLDHFMREITKYRHSF